MTTPSLIIGPNYSVTNTLYEVVAANPHATCQVTLGDRLITPKDRDAVATVCQEMGTSVYIHTHLHTNLAKVDASSGMKRLKKDLKVLGAYSGGPRIPGGAVLHVGKACDYTTKKSGISAEHRTTALSAIATRLNTITPHLPHDGSPMLLLENAAGQGTEVGTIWEDFRYLAERIDLSSRLGVCLDTQHAFASGMTRWDTYTETNRVLDSVAESGLRLGLVHLNDSDRVYNSRVDRHGSIGQGYIWKESQDSLIELLARCAEESIPVILETPTQHQDLDYIYSRLSKE